MASTSSPAIISTSVVPFHESRSILISPSWTIQHALIRLRDLSSTKATIAPSDQTAIPKGDNLSFQSAWMNGMLSTPASSIMITLRLRTRLGLTGLPSRMPALTASSGFSAGSGSGSRSRREIRTAVSCTWVTSGNGGEVIKFPDSVSNTRLNSTDLPMLFRRRIPDSSSSLINLRCNFPNGRCSPIRIWPGVMIQTTLRSNRAAPSKRHPNSNANRAAMPSQWSFAR